MPPRSSLRMVVARHEALFGDEAGESKGEDGAEDEALIFADYLCALNSRSFLVKSMQICRFPVCCPTMKSCCPPKATSTQKSRVCTIPRLGIWVLLLFAISSPLPNTQHISRRKCQDRMAVTNGDASACPTPPGEQSVNAHKTLPSPGEVGPEDELYFLNDRARVAEIDGSESMPSSCMN